MPGCVKRLHFQIGFPHRQLEVQQTRISLVMTTDPLSVKLRIGGGALWQYPQWEMDCNNEMWHHRINSWVLALSFFRTWTFAPAVNACSRHTVSWGIFFSSDKVKRVFYLIHTWKTSPSLFQLFQLDWLLQCHMCECNESSTVWLYSFSFFFKFILS